MGGFFLNSCRLLLAGLVVVVAADAVCAALAVSTSVSADVALSERMRERLDEGKPAEALALARRLLHSKDKVVRRRTADALAWLGKKAMPEILVMLGDEDADVAGDAVVGWELAYDELTDDADKVASITNAVCRVMDKDKAEAVLLHFSDVDEVMALSAMDNFLVEHRDQPAASYVKRAFSHHAGESWVSSERTAQIISGLLARKVMPEVGNEASKIEELPAATPSEKISAHGTVKPQPPGICEKRSVFGMNLENKKAGDNR